MPMPRSIWAMLTPRLALKSTRITAENHHLVINISTTTDLRAAATAWAAAR
jgi:hypothetical protein